MSVQRKLTAFMRIQLHISALTILLLLTLVTAAQDMKALKAGVVRIKNNNSGEVGAGFIVGIHKDLIYIVTASHVVKGADNPQVYLFNNQFQALPAEQLNRDEDNPKGLALVLVRSHNGETLSGLATLKFADSSEVNGGEGVKIIGFPASTSFWDVSAGIISRLEGNNLIFAAPIRGGNSGGPVILSDGRVIGMVTDTTESQGTSSAPKAEVIVSYVNGLIPGLIDSSPVGTRKVNPIVKENEVPNDQFCRTLTKLVDSSRNNFYPIVGAATNSENTFYPKISLPGARGGYVIPKDRVYYSMLNGVRDKSAVESEFYALVSRVKMCMPSWKETEKSDSGYRYHIFNTGQGSTVVRVYFNVISQGETHFFLIISIDLFA
jgi:V8-like Glu-specific endopeptidase